MPLWAVGQDNPNPYDWYKNNPVTALDPNEAKADTQEIKELDQ